jgi:hypothetical protein
MVAQFGQSENYSVCSKMHKVRTDIVVCDAKASPGIVFRLHAKYHISFPGSSFMRCLVVMQDEGWAVLCSLTNKKS